MKIALTYSCDLEDIPFSVSQMLDNLSERLEHAQEELANSSTNLREGSIQIALEEIDDLRQLLAKIDHRLMDCTSILAGYVKADPSHVISITPDVDAAALHANGKLPTGLHPAQQFSKVVLADGRSMRVVGNPNMVGDKAKKLLFG